MTTLCVVLWVVFLADACLRVSGRAWVFRPGTPRPLQRGGDFSLQAIGELVIAPLVPWGCVLVADAEPATGYREWTDVETRLRPLRWSSTLLGVLLLLVLPVLALRGAFTPWATWWLAATLAALAVTLWWYVRLRREWGLSAAPSPMLMLLSPVSAIHAPHALTRHVYANADPVRIASDLLPGPEMVTALRVLWWDDQAARRRVEQLLDARGLRAALQSAPLRQGPDVTTFCPRCHSQFVRPRDVCSDCHVPLATFGETTMGEG